jgi:flagellar biosynthesis GTPase FlhF
MGSQTPDQSRPRSDEVTNVDQRAFRDGYEPASGDVFIAILGVTGAGKSTFISKCSEKQVAIGHNLQACTQEVGVYLCKSRDFNIYLVDTPGFDDTDRSDTEVLREIASWLTASYSNSIKLHGIIYLHRITDPRMQGSGMRNLHMFKRLCGDQNLSNVVMATCQWERVLEEDGIERERQLKETKHFWGYMVERGSQVHRHYNTRESALKLIDSLVGGTTSRPKIVLDIQAQMVDEGKDLSSTGAGKALDDAISKERERFAKQIAESQADLKEALASRDRETAEILRQHQEEMNARVRKLDTEHSALQVSLERLQEERFSKLKKALEEAERVNAEAKAMMEATKKEQERRQKILEDQIRAKDDAAAKHKQEMAELQAKVDALQLPQAVLVEKYAIALHDFAGGVEGDLPFVEGDRILVTKHSERSDEWWTGELSGLTGIFPANYVEWEHDWKEKVEVAPQPKAKNVSANKLRTRSAPGINSLLLWSASISLWADSYFLIAYITDMSGNLPADMLAERTGLNNGNRYAALGENGSFYVHYHDALMQCWTLRSDNFSKQYPSAENYLTTYEQFGCPTCVSLGKNSMYFIRTAWGASYSIPDDAEAHLGDMSLVQSFWFGKDGAWVAVKTNGDRSWNLKTHYSSLAERIRNGVNGETRIQVCSIAVYSLLRMELQC